MPAFYGLMAPRWRTEARGVIAGLTQLHHQGPPGQGGAGGDRLADPGGAGRDGRRHRAAAHELRVDGGMTSNNLLMQFIADVLDMPVVRPMVAETVALGAAYAAGLSVGYWPDLQVLRRNWQLAAQWRPSLDPAHVQSEYENWHRAVELTLNWTRTP